MVPVLLLNELLIYSYKLKLELPEGETSDEKIANVVFEKSPNIEKSIVKGTSISIDATHIEANTNEFYEISQLTICKSINMR